MVTIVNRRRKLILLLGGADHDLVHGDPAGPCDDIGHGVRHVFSLQALDTGSCVTPGLYRGAHMGTELSLCRAGLEH